MFKGLITDTAKEYALFTGSLIPGVGEVISARQQQQEANKALEELKILQSQPITGQSTQLSLTGSKTIILALGIASVIYVMKSNKRRR